MGMAQPKHLWLGAFKMAISQDVALLNYVNSLDAFFASMREKIDNTDHTTVIETLNMIESTIVGMTRTDFTKGIIFGLDVCQIGQLGDTWGLFYGPAGPSDSLFKNTVAHDWVVTRGNVFNGTKIVNIEPIDGQLYAYKIAPHLTDEMVDLLIPGAVFYNVLTNNFETALLGQRTTAYPVRAINKEGVDTVNMIASALSDKYYDNDFWIATPANRILVSRFILDVNNKNDYELYNMDKKDLYPFSKGQPYYNFMFFAMNIYKNIKNILVQGYDSILVNSLMYNIVYAAVWGAGTNAFYTYWTTGGRSLPINVKYYYNTLFTPPIP